MGVIGEKLKEKGWSKSKIELLGIGITLLFFAVLIWFVFESALLEGKCKATLLTGEKIKYDPNDPPNFTEQLVYVNLSFMEQNCSREQRCTMVWVCNYSYEKYDCWVGPC